jgi:uncharacterized delta-60 repeat protein
MESPSFKMPRCKRRSVTYAVLAFLILSPVFSGSFQSTPALAGPQEVATQSAAGDLDPSFGDAGKVVTDFSSNDDGASAVAIQSDGKIVVGGTSTPPDGNSDFALARYNADGSLDPSFGSNGRVTTDFFAEKDFLHAIVIQSDGRIVAAGSAVQPGVGSGFALARYNPDGSLDEGFGSRGKTATSFPDQAEAFALAMTAAGRILAVGSASIQTLPKCALARYSSDGALDSSFGTNGKVLDTIRSGANHGLAVALQSDNKIVVAGDDNQNFVLFRYNANGSPDSGFGIGGWADAGFLLVSRANAVALQSEGKIVVAGFGETGILKLLFGLARHNPDGSRDGTFGDLGSLRTVISSRDDGATALAIQSNNNKILAGGFAGAAGDVFQGFADFAIVRYKPQGRLDKTFGVDGKVVTDFFGGDDRANAIALQPDGKIVLAGIAHSTSNVFAVARYLVEDFGFRFDPPIITAVRGTTMSVDMLIDHVGGFSGIVTVSPPDVSAIGIRLKPVDKIATTHTKRTLNLKLKPTAQVGDYRLTFTAQDEEGRVRTAILGLTIQ